VQLMTLCLDAQTPKQEEGAIRLLSGGIVDRRQLYEQAVVLALVAFENEKLYQTTLSIQPD
jgi:non-canonical (house-cleaning) NTP pyrophosphatase